MNGGRYRASRESEILGRAWEITDATMPESPAPLWNPKGYPSKSWAVSAWTADEGAPMVTSGIARKAATMIAAARLVAGAIAVARPGMAARVWVGRTSELDPGASVLGRALGGRDLALAAGALAAARSPDPSQLRRWTGAGTLADATDTAATLLAWSHLPRGYRIAVLGASCGAALAGALAAAGLE
jgi:hypothetical protein